MFLVCWSAKGGVGTTVVSAALAVLAARRTSVVAVDLGDDLPAALGLGDPPGPGLDAWLEAPTASAASLLRLGGPVSDDLHVVHRGPLPHRPLPPQAWARLVAAWSTASALVIVDAGCEQPPREVCDAAIASVLVTRGCYLGLRRSVRCSSRATCAVLVSEPGRALARSEVERTLGVPVLADVPWDPAVARAVDSGILATRLPFPLSRSLAAVIGTTAAAA